MSEIPAAAAAHLLSAAAAARAIRDGELRSLDLVEACLARITAREGVVHAWAWLDAESARRQAREADARRRSGSAVGPLHGLPVGIKDVFDTADMPSEYGSSSLRGRRPEQDADAVAMLRAAGAVIMGKTVTSEFGMYAATHCRNPLASDRSAGVSSAGSAAAVADHMVPLALGTQHTASTLLPASFCGVFGYKPSVGFTSMRGSNILVPRLANIGFLARSAEDLALFASVFHPAFEAPLAPVRPLRLGWVRGPAWGQVAADAKAGFAAFLEGIPLRVEEIELPGAFARAEDVTRGLLAAHLALRFDAAPGPVFESYCAPLRELIAAGRGCDAAGRAALDAAADECASAADGLLAPFDALLTLSAPGEATAAAEPGSGALCMPWSLAGLPSVSLPLLRSAHGLPIGVQMIAARGREAELLSMAAWLSGTAGGECGALRKDEMVDLARDRSGE